MLITASAFNQILTIIGALGAATTVVVLIGTVWKVIRESGAVDARRADAARELNEKVDALQHALTPNGGDSKDVGDTVTRTETKIDSLGETLTKLSDQFHQHLGASKLEHENLWNAINRRGDKL